MSYGHLFTTGNQRLDSSIGRPDLEALERINQASQINTANVPSAPSSTGMGVSVNSLGGIGKNLSNDYLVNQKLRNNGTYTKLKNKTIYAADALAHAGLNSGIL